MSYNTSEVVIAFWSNTGAVNDFEFYEFHIDNFMVVPTSTLSTDSIDISDRVSFYPNPAETTLTINSADQIERLSIMNLLGQKVQTVTPLNNSHSFDVSNLESGVYLVSVKFSDAEGVFRFVKK